MGGAGGPVAWAPKPQRSGGGGGRAQCDEGPSKQRPPAQPCQWGGLQLGRGAVWKPLRQTAGNAHFLLSHTILAISGKMHPRTPAHLRKRAGMWAPRPPPPTETSSRSPRCRALAAAAAVRWAGGSRPASSTPEACGSTEKRTRSVAGGPFPGGGGGRKKRRKLFGCFLQRCGHFFFPGPGNGPPWGVMTIWFSKKKLLVFGRPE